MEFRTDMKGHGHRWTTEELQRFIALWLTPEQTTASIAETLGVSLASVNKVALRIRQNGVNLPYRRKGHIAGRKNTYWTQEEVEYFMRRRNEGATTEQIATELDRSYQGVQGMIQRLRKEAVPFKMIGKGKHKLWDAEKLKIAIIGRGLKES